MSNLIPKQNFRFDATTSIGTFEIMPSIYEEETSHYDYVDGVYTKIFQIKKTKKFYWDYSDITINGKNYKEYSGHFELYNHSNEWYLRTSETYWQNMTPKAKEKLLVVFKSEILPYFESCNIWAKCELNNRVNEHNRFNSRISDLKKEIEELEQKKNKLTVTSGELLEVSLYNKGKF